MYSLEALEARRRVLGDEHPDTLRSIDNLAGVLASQGKYEQAEVYYREALEDRRRVLGDEHPDTLSSIYYMANVLLQLGAHKEAGPLALECYALNVKVYGNEHQETIDAIDLLIQLYDAWDKPEKAQKYSDMLPKEDAVAEDTNE